MKHVLIMEDNMQLGLEWRDAFEDQGHKVTLCHTGDEAMAYLDAAIFDLVVTDLFVPNAKDGHHVIGKLLTMHNKMPPTIAVTGTRRIKDGTEDVNFFLSQAERLGVSETIEKPFTPDALTALAKELWSSKL